MTHLDELLHRENPGFSGPPLEHAFLALVVPQSARTPSEKLRNLRLGNLCELQRRVWEELVWGDGLANAVNDFGIH